MDGWKKVLVGFLVLDLLILNGVMGWVVFEKEEVVSKEMAENVLKEEVLVREEENEIEMEEEDEGIEKRISQLEDRVEAIEDEGGKVVEKVATAKEVVKSEKVFYVPIPDGEGVSSTEWIDVVGSGFILDKASYDGMKKVYLEGNIKVLNGNGIGRVRLWDESNKRAVDGSEISSNSGDWESKESGSLSLWNGKNEYILQARSETGYRVDAGGIKLRIIVEN